MEQTLRILLAIAVTLAISTAAEASLFLDACQSYSSQSSTKQQTLKALTENARRVMRNPNVWRGEDIWQKHFGGITTDSFYSQTGSELQQSCSRLDDHFNNPRSREQMDSVRLLVNSFPDLELINSLENVREIWFDIDMDVKKTGRWDISPLLKKKTLVDLALLGRMKEDTNLEDAFDMGTLAMLAHRSDLRRLAIDDFVVRNLDFLKNAHNLQDLNLTQLRLTDLGPLFNLINLRELDLSSNKLVDIHPLMSLINLRHLGIQWNEGLNDLHVVSFMTNLQELRVNRCNLNSLSPIAHLPWLEMFEAVDNKITDLSPLSKLTRLKWLQIGENPIVDVSPLRELHKVTTLYLARNKIRDFSPLYGLQAIKRTGSSVNCEGNPDDGSCEKLHALSGKSTSLPILTD